MYHTELTTLPVSRPAVPWHRARTHSTAHPPPLPASSTNLAPPVRASPFPGIPQRAVAPAGVRLGTSPLTAVRLVLTGHARSRLPSQDRCVSVPGSVPGLQSGSSSVFIFAGEITSSFILKAPRAELLAVDCTQPNSISGTPPTRLVTRAGGVTTAW